MHLNWVFPVACSLFSVPFEEFRYLNLTAEQLSTLPLGYNSIAEFALTFSNSLVGREIVMQPIATLRQ